MSYSGQQATMFHHIRSIANTHSVPTFVDVATMSATPEHLHGSEILQHDDDSIDAKGLNDIDISRMVPGGQTNNDFTIGGAPEFQQTNTQFTHRVRRHF